MDVYRIIGPLVSVSDNHITLQNYLKNFDKASNTILMDSGAKRGSPNHRTQNNLITGERLRLVVPN